MMLLVKFFNYDIDTGWAIFMFTCFGALAWWLIKIYIKQGKLDDALTTSTDVRKQEFVETRAQIAAEVAKVLSIIANRDIVVNQTLAEINTALIMHSQKDERQFALISDSLEKIRDMTIKQATLTELLVGDKIKK